MGVNLYDKIRFENTLSNFTEKSKIDIIELGDQDLVVNGVCDPNNKFRDLYKNNFNSWRTLDLHTVDGVEIFDLSVISNEIKTADIITNFGTSEHVEPEIGQYNCWLNLHNILKLDGYILHTLVPVGGWPDHCRYYHDFNFFESFKDFGYEVIELRKEWNDLIVCTMRKFKDCEFMTYDDFFSKITFDRKSSNEIHPINNPKKLIF